MFLFYLWLCVICGILLLAYFPYSEEIKVGWCNHYAVCVSLFLPPPPPQLLNGEPIFMELGICIMAPESISAAYFINPSHQSVSICMPPLSFLGNGSVKTLPRQRYNRRVFRDEVSKESRRLVVCGTSCHCFYGLGKAAPVPLLRWTSQRDTIALGTFVCMFTIPLAVFPTPLTRFSTTCHFFTLLTLVYPLVIRAFLLFSLVCLCKVLKFLISPPPVLVSYPSLHVHILLSYVTTGFIIV
jgi:hypothetical protein